MLATSICWMTATNLSVNYKKYFKISNFKLVPIQSTNMANVAYPYIQGVGLSSLFLNSRSVRTFRVINLTFSQQEIGGKSSGRRTLVFWRASQRTTSNVADSRTSWMASTWPILSATCNADSRCGVYSRSAIRYVVQFIHIMHFV